MKSETSVKPRGVVEGSKRGGLEEKDRRASDGVLVRESSGRGLDDNVGTEIGRASCRERVS